MKNDREYDYIIVGQGLAGSALSYQLLKRRRRVMVIDNNRSDTSSKVAAGLFNPITGRKMVKTWKADILFPYLISFYKELQDLCSERFLYEIPIYRPFISLEEQNEWMGKSASEEFTSFIYQVHTRSVYPFVKDPFGGIELLHSGYLDIRKFLASYGNYLKKNELLKEDQFKYEQLQIEQNHIIYNGIQANRIIFCDGLGSSSSPYFGWLPFKPVKGEILKITGEHSLKNILNRGVFVLPLEDGTFRVGSNYNHIELDTKITEKGRAEIEEKLNELVDTPYSVVGQEAGIRPATKDRRPFIGLHPQWKTLGVFNGLGTKGVSLAPYFSEAFVSFLEDDEDLPPEVNISRYNSLYFHSIKS